MVSLDQYLLFPIEEKTHFLWHQGTFLGSRIQGRHKIELYSLFNFYVEVFNTEFDHWSKDSMIVRIEAFSQVDFLDPYLDNIRFEILKC